LTEVKIENIVATALIATELNIVKACLHLKGGEYNPERFPGLIYHVLKPKGAVLLFRSGKLVCTGTKNMDDVKTVINGIVSTLKKHKFDVVAKPQITVQNIVASADLKNYLDLVKLSLTFGIERIEYEPEQFPGLVYRLKEPKIVILLFSSGKIVLTGGRNIGDVKRAVDILKRDLTEAGFLT
jgi:transcription initiation factor TFIID TATA-box-binding protein